jgi:MFS family permease
LPYDAMMPALVLALLFIDRWGRRTPLLIGSTLMMVFMFANAGIMCVTGDEKIGASDYSLSSLGSRREIPRLFRGMVETYAPTWGPVSWIYPPELYPLRLRGKAVALSTSSNLLP